MLPADASGRRRRSMILKYREGGYLNICMHPFVSGRALRVAMLDRLIARTKTLLGVWFPSCGGSRAVLPRKISATAAAQPSEVTEIGQRWPRLVNVGRYCCATSGEEDRTVKLLPPPVRFASQLASHWTCR